MTTAALPPSPADHALLHAFARTHCHDAFSQLVHRHLPIVYAHARRILRDPDRAEDAAQAVFLLLAQRAGTLNPDVPLAGWLYKVTAYTCANAQKIDARRRHHEQEAARMSAPAPTRASPIDLELHLDRFLQQLPTHERDTLLLRYAHGHEPAAIATLTGTSESAVKKRLQRALARLRQKFLAAGVAVPAAFTPAMLLAAGPLPMHLASAATATALSPAAAAPGIVTLAHGASHMLLIAKAKIIAAVLIACTLLAGTTGLLLANRSRPLAVATVPSAPTTFIAAPASASAPAPRPVADDNVPDLIVVHGTVFDPAGKPLAGAKITVPAFRRFNQMTTHPAVQTTSDATGHYQLSFQKAEVSAFSDGEGTPENDAWQTAQIAASAPGLGMAWSSWFHADKAGNVDLHLVADDLPIEGRILTADGHPAANTHIFVESVDDYLPQVRADAIKRGISALQALPDGFAYPLSAIGRADLITDGDGRFRITSIGKNRSVSMFLYGPGAGLSIIQAATQNIATFDQAFSVIGTTKAPTVRVFGNVFTYTAPGTVSIDGIVRDAKTHAPVSGATLVGEGQITSAAINVQLLTTVTDPTGHYHLDGFPIDGKCSLVVLPNDNHPYLPREISIPAGAAGSTFPLDIDLDRGVWITGKVTDKFSGQPVCVRVQYAPYVGNPATLPLPEFQQYPHGGGKMDGVQWQYEDKPDGSYRIVAVPGKGVIGVQSWSRPAVYRTGVGAEKIAAYASTPGVNVALYQSYPMAEFCNDLAEVDVPATGTLAPVDFQLDPGTTVHAQIVDADGKSVPGCFVEHNAMAGNGSGLGPLTTAAFDITGLGPDESRTLIVANMDRKLGIVLPFSTTDAKDGTLTIPLQPMAEISGHCIDPQGNPAAKMMIVVSARAGDLGYCTTDDQGNFHCPITPGADIYEAHVAGGPYMMSRIARNFTIDPGEFRDLGTIRLKKSRSKN